METFARSSRNARLALLACLLALLSASGCVSTPYHYGTGRIAEDAPRSPPMPQQFLYGRPHKFLDASDWFWPQSLLGKLLLWNKNVDSHQISPATVEMMQAFIDKNELTNVQVHVNGYYPGNQWKRLFKNRTVGGGWRFTLGILSVINYTILPGRFFGGDAYNPYTNTIYLYSDEPAIALHEAGHSKDFGSRKYKGTHAFIYQLPVTSLYYEAKASNDALSYLRCNTELSKEAYNLLYPAWATYVGGNVTRFDENPWYSLAVIPGHIVGRIKSANVEPCAPGEEVPSAGAAPADTGTEIQNPDPAAVEPGPQEKIGSAREDSASEEWVAFESPEPTSY